jgi:hypothetical protein
MQHIQKISGFRGLTDRIYNHIAVLGNIMFESQLMLTWKLRRALSGEVHEVEIFDVVRKEDEKERFSREQIFELH